MRKNNPNKSPEEQRIAACRTALNILGYRDNPESKLRSKLRERGYGEDIIDSAIDFLKEKGYLCEERMIERAAEELARTRHFGRKRIILELNRRGFSRAAVSELDFSVEPLCEIDFPALCAETLRKRGGVADQKTYAYLLRHGFSSDDIREAKRLLSEMGELDQTEEFYQDDEFFE